MDVASTPSADPNDPEHEKRAIREKRELRSRQQIRFAAISYTLSITTMAIVAGFVLNPLVLLAYTASAILVTLAMLRWRIGQFSASALQGVVSAFLFIKFGPLHPLALFMLASHIILASLYWHWIDLIVDANY